MVTVTFHNLAYDEELRFPGSAGSAVTVTLEGHAIPGDLFREGGDEQGTAAAKGENVICAAVSFAGLNLVRSMTIMTGISPEYTIESGLIRLSIETGRLDDETLSIARVLIESFLIGVLDVERKYGSLVKVIINPDITKRT